MRIEHTSAREIGQVYVPVVNRILLVAVLLATIGFGSSTAMLAPSPTRLVCVGKRLLCVRSRDCLRNDQEC